jgi:hypothetical protein
MTRADSCYGLARHFCFTEEEPALIANDAIMYCLGGDAESADK